MSDYRVWVFVVGFAAILFGTAQVHLPSAFILGGTILCSFAAVAIYRGRK